MSNISEAKRIVIKVGTSTLAHKTGHINIRLLEQLVKVMADIKNYGKELVLVSSGAIGVGMGKLGMKERPKDTPGKQAAAAVGQCELMYLYDRYFSEYNHIVAQVLLTKEVLDQPESRQNAHNAFETLLRLGAIPIVNENDTICTEEIEEARFGDNDTLSAVVCNLLDADCLVILSDIDGLYTANPALDKDAKLVERVETIDDALLHTASGAVSGLGTGGMLTKLFAARMVTEQGKDMYIINGTRPAGLYDLIDGVAVGTHFLAGQRER